MASHSVTACTSSFTSKVNGFPFAPALIGEEIEISDGKSVGANRSSDKGFQINGVYNAGRSNGLKVRNTKIHGDDW